MGGLSHACAALALAAAMGHDGAAALECRGECHLPGASPLMAARRVRREELLKVKLSAMADQPERAPLPHGLFAPCTAGLADDFFECSGIDLLSETPHAEQGSNAVTASDIWGWVDPNSGREYALTTFTDGAGFVDVTEPLFPKPLYWLPSSMPSNQAHFWRDVKVYNNTAYIVADFLPSHGMQVFDLTRLRDSPEELTTVEADVVFRGFGYAHNIFVNEDTGFAFAVGGDRCHGGIYLLDLRDDPLDPQFAGCWSDDGYVHDLQCIVYDGPDLEFVGHEICFCYDEYALTIIDITDKEVDLSNSALINVEILATVFYPDLEYTHQGWVTDDHRFLLLDDEGFEVKNRSMTFEFNITSLRSAYYMTREVTDIIGADHNQYIKDGLTYQSNYASGLRIKSLAPVEEGQPVEEVAFFDTYPTDTGSAVTFDGAWSTYIYLPSGNLLVSSQEYGLLVVREQRLEPLDTGAPSRSPTRSPTRSPEGGRTAAPTASSGPALSSIATVGVSLLAIIVVSAFLLVARRLFASSAGSGAGADAAAKARHGTETSMGDEEQPVSGTLGSRTA